MNYIFENFPYYFTDFRFYREVSLSMNDFFFVHMPEAALIVNNIIIGDNTSWRLATNMSKCYIDATYLFSWSDEINIWNDHYYINDRKNEYDVRDEEIWELFGIEVAKEHPMYYNTTWLSSRVTQTHIADLRKGSMTPYDYSFWRFPYGEVINYFNVVDQTSYFFEWKKHRAKVFSDLNYIPHHMLMNHDYAVRTIVDNSSYWFNHHLKHPHTLTGGYYVFFYEPYGSFDALFHMAFTTWYQFDLPQTKQLWDLGGAMAPFYGKLNYDLPDVVFFSKSFFSILKLEDAELLSERFQYIWDFHIPEWDPNVLFDIYA